MITNRDPTSMGERRRTRAFLLALANVSLALAAPFSAANDEDTCVVHRVNEEVAELRKRPWLGGELESIERDGRRQIRVAHLLPKGPLAAAGVQVNDVVLAVAGAEVSTPLPPAGVSAGGGLPGLQHGRSVALRLSRNGGERELQVMPLRLPDTALPDALGLKVLRDHGWFSDGEAKFEMTAAADDCLAQYTRDLLLKLRQQAWVGLYHLQILETEEGADLHVLKLYPESPAAAAGVQEGDVILAIDRVDISTMAFRRAGVAIRQILYGGGIQPGRRLHFRLRRGDSELEVELTPPVLRGYPLAMIFGSRLLKTAKIYFYETEPTPSQLRPPN
jgi:C-terminal processing protease CtpA/Prc